MTLTIKNTACFTLILSSSMQITTTVSSKAINYLVFFINLNDQVNLRCQKGDLMSCGGKSLQLGHLSTLIYWVIYQLELNLINYIL